MGSILSKYRGLVEDFASTVWASRHGKVLLPVWGSFFLWLYIFRHPRRRKGRGGSRVKDRDHRNDGKTMNSELGLEAEGEKTMKEKKKGKAKGTRGSLWWLIDRLLRSSSFIQHCGPSLFLYILSLVTRIGITVKLGDLGGKTGSLISGQRFRSMFAAQAEFGVWCMLAALQTALMKFLQRHLTVLVRRELHTDLTARYLADGQTEAGILLPYHAIGDTIIDVPSRLTSDVREVADQAVHVFGHMLKPAIDILYVSSQLTSRIGFVPLTTFYAFFFWAQTALARYKASLPRGLKEMSRDLATREARLRDHQSRVRERREQIALQGAHAYELMELKEEFTVVEERMSAKNAAMFVVDTLSACESSVSLSLSFLSFFLSFFHFFFLSFLFLPLLCLCLSLFVFQISILNYVC